MSRGISVFISTAASLALVLGGTTACTAPNEIGGKEGAGETSAPATAEEAIDESQSEPKVTVVPSAEPAPAVKLPDCEQILTLEEARSIMSSEATLFYGQSADMAPLRDDTRLGPAALKAFESSTDSFSCTWYIPSSDGFLHFYVADLPQSERDTFIGALRKSDYVESASADGSPIFEHDDGAQGIGIGPMRFAIVGTWLVHTQVPAEILPDVTASLERAQQN